MTPETEAMWNLLGKLALEKGQLKIAERSYAALGDVARARYLSDTISLAEDAEKKFVSFHFGSSLRSLVL